MIIYIRETIPPELMKEYIAMVTKLADILAKEKIEAAGALQLKDIIIGMAKTNADDKLTIAALQQQLADAGLDQTLLDQIATSQATTETTLQGLLPTPPTAPAVDGSGTGNEGASTGGGDTSSGGSGGTGNSAGGGASDGSANPAPSGA